MEKINDLKKEHINWISYKEDEEYITVFYNNNIYVEDRYCIEYRIYKYPKFIKKFIYQLYKIFKFDFLFQIEFFLQDSDFYKIDSRYYINIWNVYDITFDDFSFLTNCKICFNGFYYTDDCIRMSSHFLLEDEKILNYIRQQKLEELLESI